MVQNVAKEKISGQLKSAILDAKACLAHDIVKIFEKKRLTQREAAKLVGLSQPDVSALKMQQGRTFSIDRLFIILASLKRKITVLVNQNSKPGTVSINCESSD